jgi:hypothetical protein
VACRRARGIDVPTMAFQIACGVWVIEIERLGLRLRRPALKKGFKSASPDRHPPLVSRGLRVTNNPIPARAPFPSIPRQGPRALGRRQDQSTASPGGYIDAPSPEDSRPFPANPDIATNFSIFTRKVVHAAMRHFGRAHCRHWGDVWPASSAGLNILSDKR